MGKTMKIEEFEINFKALNLEMPWKKDEHDDCAIEDGYMLRSFLDRMYHFNRLANYFSKIFANSALAENQEISVYNSYVASNVAVDYVKRILPDMNIMTLVGSRYFEHGAKSAVHSVIFIGGREGRRSILDLMPMEYGYVYREDGKKEYKFARESKIISYFPTIGKFEPTSCYLVYPLPKKFNSTLNFIKRTSEGMIQFIKDSLEKIHFSPEQGTIDLEEFMTYLKTIQMNYKKEEKND